MRTSKNQSRKAIQALIVIGISPIFFLTLSCKSENTEIELTPESVEKNNVIEILTENMDFQAPDTIPSGWTTWRYTNKSTQPHFILIDDYVDSITVKEFKEELLPAYGEGISKLYEGKNISPRF